MLNAASDVSGCVRAGGPSDFQRVSSDAGGAASSLTSIFPSSFPPLILTPSSQCLSLSAQRTVLVACVTICQCFIFLLGLDYLFPRENISSQGHSFVFLALIPKAETMSGA